MAEADLVTPCWNRIGVRHNFDFDDIQGQAAIDASLIDPLGAGTAVIGDFDTLDANGDSYLDNDEIAERADATGVFEAWDADADSELDRDEIAGNASELWDRDGNDRISEEEWETATELWYPQDPDFAVFGDVDGDGDSEVDADEFAEGLDISALGEEWTSTPLDVNAFKQACFGLYDTDEDGRVSRRSGTTARQPSAHRAQAECDAPRTKRPTRRR